MASTECRSNHHSKAKSKRRVSSLSSWSYRSRRVLVRRAGLIATLLISALDSPLDATIWLNVDVCALPEYQLVHIFCSALYPMLYLYCNVTLCLLYCTHLLPLRTRVNHALAFNACRGPWYSVHGTRDVLYSRATTPPTDTTYRITGMANATHTYTR